MPDFEISVQTGGGLMKLRANDRIVVRRFSNHTQIAVVWDITGRGNVIVRKWNTKKRAWTNPTKILPRNILGKIGDDGRTRITSDASSESD